MSKLDNEIFITVAIPETLREQLREVEEHTELSFKVITRRAYEGIVKKHRNRRLALEIGKGLNTGK